VKTRVEAEVRELGEKDFFALVE